MSDYLHKLRVDLSAAFRWAVRLNYHESVANHFSVAINDRGTQFLINPNARHFSRIRASELLILDVNNQETMVQPNAPDPTAWGLHGAVHRRCSRASCVLHVHSIFSTVLACLKDPRLPAIDQNTAQFHNRVIIDKGFDGMAFDDEGERCAAMLGDPNKKVMVMGNHGVMVIGSSVSDAFNRLFYFERSAETYIRALQTGLDLNFLSDEVAEKTAQQWETYDGTADAHFSELKAILDSEEPDYKD